MAVLDFAQREITAKLVYFGARKSGVSTNLEQLARTGPGPAQLLRFGPDDRPDVTLCFEYVSNRHVIKGFPLRVQVFGIPGELEHGGLRRQVLGGVDAIVFVADARMDRDQANVDSLLELEQLLRGQHMQLTDVPLVIQVNHTDAPNARDPEQVVVDLNPYGFPVHTAIARSGEGVHPTHETALDDVARRLERALAGERSRITLEAVRATRRRTLAMQVDEHMSAFRVEAARKARAADPKIRYANLPVEERISLPYQIEALRGTRPATLLNAELSGERIAIDIVQERLSGEHPTRIRVFLENRPTDQQQVPQLTAVPISQSETTDVTAGLPDSVEIAPAPEPQDLPPVLYGLIGVAGGLAVGLLLGVLLFL